MDSIFSRFRLDDAAGYRRFLLAQAGAFLPAEAALDDAGADRVIADWAGRRRAAFLRQDLHALGAPAPQSAPLPPLAGDAAILGTAYVLEGSRLGGALLRKAVAEDLPRAFLSAPAEPGAWRGFIALLGEQLDSPDKVDAAIEAARTTFAAFERSAISQLEPANG